MKKSIVRAAGKTVNPVTRNAPMDSTTLNAVTLTLQKLKPYAVDLIVATGYVFFCILAILVAMEIELVSIDRELVTVLPGSIPPLLGITENDLDPHTRDLIDTYITECRSIMDPRGGYARFQALSPDSEEDIEIEGTSFMTGKIIRNMLRNAEEYAFFVVTAGPEPEELSRSLINSAQFLEGYIVDLVGSGIVESVANQVHQHVKDVAGSAGMKITNRYSPGYCSWHVSEQQKLFSLLPDGCCGITLSESSLMSPIKSVSGIIGMGRSVVYNDYICEICPMKECLFRQIIQRESGIS